MNPSSISLTFSTSSICQPSHQPVMWCYEWCKVPETETDDVKYSRNRELDPPSGRNWIILGADDHVIVYMYAMPKWWAHVDYKGTTRIPSYYNGNMTDVPKPQTDRVRRIYTVVYHNDFIFSHPTLYYSPHINPFPFHYPSLRWVLISSYMPILMSIDTCKIV